MSQCAQCFSKEVSGDKCSTCHMDLDLGHALDAVGRVCFNRALELAARGQGASAEEQLCAACALMPRRVEARRALGKVRAQLRKYELAYADFEVARQLAPDDAGTLSALHTIRAQLKRELWMTWGTVGGVVVLLTAGILLARVAMG